MSSEECTKPRWSCVSHNRLELWNSYSSCKYGTKPQSFYKRDFSCRQPFLLSLSLKVRWNGFLFKHAQTLDMVQTVTSDFCLCNKDWGRARRVLRVFLGFFRLFFTRSLVVLLHAFISRRHAVFQWNVLKTKQKHKINSLQVKIKISNALLDSI